MHTLPDAVDTDTTELLAIIFAAVWTDQNLSFGNFRAKRMPLLQQNHKMKVVVDTKLQALDSVKRDKIKLNEINWGCNSYYRLKAVPVRK